MVWEILNDPLKKVHMYMIVNMCAQAYIIHHNMKHKHLVWNAVHVHVLALFGDDRILVSPW